ncbi:serine/threonine protein kinase [Actinomadura barringtoniae]|uniref:Serine/threonine protein kinase n=1 Tax=Actinomadura barringtoniae TaxID=1427535 RepID=A0A939PMB6_9ACTN|nr:serine/threonine-protein kinase [Actinomadura barringtoniae]MBO2451186.1 serine/threonine protein kinase [Actinomadura barringtoniae]
MGSRHAPVQPLSRNDPSRIGAYTLLGRLGAGAMGRVYLGRSAAGRLVAVKTIRSELAGEGDFRARFRHEIDAARRVSGAFTAAVIEADPDAEVPWLATSYVAAPSLDLLVKSCGPLPPAAVRWLAAGCAEALESIHRTGLLHRDLKPSNVLVSADGLRVIDFGVARAAERSTLTATRQAVGTPAYMAPEQARNARKTVQASDIFSLGSTLLYAATGHPPYKGDSVTEILTRLATEPPDLTDLPEALHEVVTHCLARDPADRPTAATLLDTLGSSSPSMSPAHLPDCALELIEEHRQWPRSTSPEDPTFASATSTPEIREPAPTQEPQKQRAPHLPTLLAAAIAVAMLLIGGTAGALIFHQSSSSTNPPRGGPPAEPDAPLSGAAQRPDGNPRILLNQPLGDGNTVFVVHGRGWPPGAQITIRLDKRPPSPSKPTVDARGTWNYAINQSHEFIAGKLPPGVHEVTASSNGTVTHTRFTVNNL